EKFIERLENYELDPQDILIKKNILVSIIDALSRTTSNFNDSNRIRFTRVVEKFGDWPDCSRVSPPHVTYVLNQLRAPEFEPAREFFKDVIDKNSSGKLIELGEDPELNDLKIYWPVPVEQKIYNQLSLTSFTHLNLLYSYRNSLVHEFREPGKGMEFHNDHLSPCYHGVTSFEGEHSTEGRKSLELVYPIKFYFILTKS